MNKQKSIALLRFVLTTLGIAAVLIVAYVSIGNPTNLTSYECIMTALASAFATDWLNRLS